MADPLSISASIAGLLSLADIVFGRVFRYAKAVQGSDSEIAQLAERTQSLSGVLHSLLLLAMELDTEGPAHEFRFRHLISCGNTLRKIKQKLESKTPTSLTHNPAASVKNKLLWPFSSSETKKLVAELSEHQTAISQVTTADSLTQLLSALSVQNDIRDGVERLQDCFDDIKDGLERRWELETRISISEERQKVLDFFGNVDPSSNHNTSLQLRHPGTGQWLIDHELFRRWQKTPASKLWLSGIPGAGKTVLASLIIEESLKGSSHRKAVAYFYCDYKDRDRQNPTKILGSLAAQLSKQDESQESFKILEGYYAACHPPGRGSQFADAQVLVKSIQDMSVSFEEVSIIVDGLDECDDNQIEVVEVLRELNADEYSNIRTLFLSRDEHVLRIHLEDTYDHIPIAAHNDDLRFYVEAEVELRVRKRRLRVKNPSLKQEIVERLVDGADGMFRWVVCQLDYLCELPDDAARRKALKNLPPDLFATYERILERVNRQGPEVQELVENTLRMLLFESSMSCNLLCGALAIKDGVDQFDHEAVPDDEEVLIRCSSLVRRVYGKDYHPGTSHFEISHFTVKEFLVSIDPVRTKHLSRYHLSFMDARTKVLCMQLTYLSLKNSSSELDKSLGNLENRLELDPLRIWAIRSIRNRIENFDDHEIFERLKIMLGPAKTLNCLAWVQDTLFWDLVDFNDNDKFRLVTSAIASGSMTTLHFAAMLRLPKLVEWLLSCGCEPNQMSDFGTPVHCALSGLALSSGVPPHLVATRLESITEAKATLEVLLSGGATCSRNTVKTMWRKETSAMGIVLQSNSPRFMGEHLPSWESVLQLIPLVGNSGGRLNEADFIELECLASDAWSNKPIIDSISREWVPEHLRVRYDRLYDRLETVRDAIDPQDGDHPLTMELDDEGMKELEEYFRDCAGMGFMYGVEEALKRPGVKIDAADDSGQTALHKAASMGQHYAMKFLLESGASVDKTDNDGQTPLHKCALARNIQAFNTLLEFGVDLLAIDDCGRNIWHLAARKDNSDVLTALRLLTNPPAGILSTPCHYGLTPLSHAVDSGAFDTARSLIKRTDGWEDDPEFARVFLAQFLADNITVEFRQNLNKFSDRILLTGTFRHDFIRCAIESKDPDLVASILSRGIRPHDIETTLLHEPTPLETACLSGCSPEISDLLIEATDLSGLSRVRPEDGKSLMHILCSEGSAHVCLLQQLLQKPIDVNMVDTDGRTALMTAAISTKPEHAVLLLENGADPGLIDKYSWNFLHHAAISSSNGCFKILEQFRIPDRVWQAKCPITVLGRENSTNLDEFAPSLNAKNTFVVAGTNLLHLLIDLPEVMQHVLDNKLVAVDCPAINGYTPLHHAVLHCKMKATKLLISHGANVNARTAAGVTVLHFAAENSIGLFKYLLEAGAEPNAITHNGNLPLHIAASMGKSRIVSLILESGSIAARNDKGMSPEFCALAAGHTHTSELISEAKSQGLLVAPFQSEQQKAAKLSRALLLAISQKNKSFISHLLDEGANVDATPLHSGVCGCTPLVAAFESRLPDVAMDLIERGASLNFETCEKAITPGLTATHLAALSPDFDKVLQTLIEKSPMPLEYDALSALHPLHVAVEVSNKLGLRILLDHYSTYRPGRSGNTNLPRGQKRLTMQKASKFVPRSIIDIRARAAFKLKTPKFRVEKDSTPLERAVGRGEMDAVELLLDFGADVNKAVEGHPPLAWAILIDDKEKTGLLLQHGADPNAREYDMQTPASTALSNGSFETLDILEEFGADCSFSDWKDRGIDFLEFTKKSEAIPVAKHLIEKGYPFRKIYELTRPFSESTHADGMAEMWHTRFNSTNVGNASDDDSGCDLHDPNTLMSVGPVSLIKRALKFESKHSKVEKRFEFEAPGSRRSRLCKASIADRTDVINLLLQYGADIDAEGCPDGSALMVACAVGRRASVELLVRKGATLVYDYNGQRRSALVFAEKYPKIQRWLLVERHTEQFKILPAEFAVPDDDDTLKKPRVNLQEVRIPWKGRFQRYYEESSFEHFLRLKKIREEVFGRVIYRPADGTDPSDIFVAL